MRYLVNFNDRIIFTSDGKKEVLIKDNGGLVYYDDLNTNAKYIRNFPYFIETDNLDTIRNILLDDLKDARDFVKKLFKEKEDRAGKPYIKHLIFVCDHVDTLQEKIVALLHDTLEDIDTVSYENIVEKFGANVAQEVDTLTNKTNTSYEDYIKNIKGNYIATNVKLADLLNNMDLNRLKDICDEDLVRKEKYQKAYDYLKGGCIY